MRLPSPAPQYTGPAPAQSTGPWPVAAPSGAPTTRRQWLAGQAPLTWALVGGASTLGAARAHALPARVLQFPRDFGSHPELRTEWWYITGHLQTGDGTAGRGAAPGRPWGFQLTFFRSRVDAAQPLQSAFAAKQLLFAHAAVTDLQGQQLLHDQRIARAGFGVARASEQDTDIRLHDWSLRRHATGSPASAPGPAPTPPPARAAAVPPHSAAPAPSTFPPMPALAPMAGSRYSAHIEGDGFGLELDFTTTQPVLLQGQQGLSRKGPEPVQASYYYSQPQMTVSGHLRLGTQRLAVQPGSGRAWLDHECSEALLHPEAVGWDWIGMNLFNGTALTAFRLRRAEGSTLWAGGSWRPLNAGPDIFAADQVRFTPLRHWTSPHSGAHYPVAWRVDTPHGTLQVHALLDAQELDSTGSTGAIYWEGLSELRDASGQAVGRGYLEMTGYAKALRL